MPLGFPTTREAAMVSPTRPAWAPQSHLEPLLVTMLLSAASAQLRFDTELIGLEHGSSGGRVSNVSNRGIRFSSALPRRVGMAYPQRTRSHIFAECPQRRSGAHRWRRLFS